MSPTPSSTTPHAPSPSPLTADGTRSGATQLGVALGSRARPGSLANPFLLVAVGTALALQAAGVYLPSLRALLGTEPLPLMALAIACVLSGLGHVVMRLQRRLFPERPPHARPVIGRAPG